MEDKYGLYIVAIVGIVAVVSLLVLILGHGSVTTTTNGDSSGQDVTGAAYSRAEVCVLNAMASCQSESGRTTTWYGGTTSYGQCVVDRVDSFNCGYSLSAGINLK